MARRQYFVSLDSPHRQIAYPNLAMGQEWYVTAPPTAGTFLYAPSPPIGLSDGLFLPAGWTWTNPLFFSQIQAIWQGPMIPDSFQPSAEWFTFLFWNREYYYTPALEPYMVVVFQMYCLTLLDPRFAARSWASSWPLSQLPSGLQWEMAEPISGLTATANINVYLDPP